MTTQATQFLTDLKDLAVYTVTITGKSSVNSYGEVVRTGPGTSYSCYLHKVSTSDRTLTMDGQTVEYRMYIASESYSPSLDDLVTFSGVSRPVVEVDVRLDEFGQQFVVLGLGQPRRS